MANLSNINNKFLVTTGGNVGIGVTGPVTKLNVAGNIAVTATKAYRMYNAANNGWGEMSFIEADNRIQFNRGIQNSGADWRLSENSANSFVCANEGNFGIGTDSPDHKLRVNGDARLGNLHIKTSDFGSGGTGKTIYADGAGSGVLGFISTTAFDFSNGSTSRVRIDSSGNVGIGTTTPGQKLVVNTTATAGVANLSDIDRTSGNLVRFTNPQYSSDASMGILLRVFPDSDARQGAGIIASGGGTNARTNLSLFVSTDGAGTSSLSYAALTAIGLTGNVGIGTTTPSSKLQVAGGIQMADDTDTAVAAKVGTMRYRTGTEYVETTGTQLLLNNNFDTDTVWVKGTGWAISGGKANATASTDYLSQNPWNPTTNNYYQITWTISNYSAGTYRFYMRGNVTADFGTSTYVGNGTFTQVMQAGSGGASGFLFDARGALTASIDNIIVTEVTVEDASYADMCMQTGASTYEWVNIVRNTY